MVNQVTDPETQANLSKLLCVRTSGFVESSFKNLILDYIDGTSPQPVQTYVSQKIKNITNLNYKKLHETLCLFHENWGQNLQEKITDEQEVALNAIVSNRHLIAHGENDSISYLLMNSYYNNVKGVVGLLQNIIKR